MDANNTPDYLEPLIGWRRWRLTDEGHIRAISMSTEWKPYEALTAIHENGGWTVREGHEDPCGCTSCGIYAHQTKAHLRASTSMQASSRWLCEELLPCVVGRVALWGKVVIHERGYRAQYAYPLDIVYAHDCDGATIARTYGVPFHEDPSWTSVFQSEQSLSNHSPHQFLTGYHQWYLTQPRFGLNPPWSSRYLYRPEDHKFIIEPDHIEADQPGLPKGMNPLKIEAPKRYQRSSGIWMRGDPEFGVTDDLTCVFTSRYYVVNVRVGLSDIAS